MEEVVSPENYGKALRAVIANDVAPGIDGMRTEELNGHLWKHRPKIQGKLIAGTYVPSPARRKKIRKENGGGMRMLGIPTVLDRAHPADVAAGYDPIWEPRFSTQLWIPAGAKGGGCGARRTKIRRNGQGLGRGFGY